MEVPRLSVREALICTTLDIVQVERDPARYNSPEWRQAADRRQQVVDYVRQHGSDAESRFLARLVKSIPEHVRGPVMPEVPFVIEEPSDEQKIRIPRNSGADVVQLRPPAELLADPVLPIEEVA